MLTAGDDFPIHQVAEPIRHVGTSDRNFYDRYYFNAHNCSGDLFLVLGLGLYPNLGTQDAFAVVRRGDKHRVVRSSRELDDRMDLTTGPLRVEVVEPLKKIRFVLEATEHPLALDMTFEGAHEAFEEPKQLIRNHGRLLFDTARFCQNGRWSGTLEVGRRDLHRRARHLVGHAGPVVGRPPRRRGRAARHPGRRRVDGRPVELRADAVRRPPDLLHLQGGARRQPHAGGGHPGLERRPAR